MSDKKTPEHSYNRPAPIYEERGLGIQVPTTNQVKPPIEKK